ncbi:MAG: DUF1697 domain-containing protein [Candidatus Saccharimonas sp.]
MHSYIAIFRGVQADGKNTVPMERLEYAFHTFSLRNECAYEATGDVTFGSINPDTESLEGGVERMVSAVLRIDVEAVVLSAEQLRQLLDATADDVLSLGKAMIRSRKDLEALYTQSLETHQHEH